MYGSKKLRVPVPNRCAHFHQQADIKKGISGRCPMDSHGNDDGRPQLANDPFWFLSDNVLLENDMSSDEQERPSRIREEDYL